MSLSIPSTRMERGNHYQLRLEVESCVIKATGLLDLKGTLAVDRDSPVGLLDLKLNVQIVSQEPAENLEKLIELSERCCVVHQTLASPPKLEIERC
ncbi:MAG: OsmC family protein [Planctomycetaceae bacterium]|nr:OsmC family protein [Planctomycetaceae bacterium]